MTAWVLVLEWEVGDGVPLDSSHGPVQVLLAEFADCRPLALCGVDRYALQLEVGGADPLQALHRTLARHREAADRARLTSWRLNRVEIITRDAFERECGDFGEDGEPLAGHDRLRLSERADPVAEAEQALGNGPCPHEARDILCRMVRQLGSGLVSARLEDEWTLPIDLSFGTGDPVLPVAEPWSHARSALEQVLPRLVEAARRSVLNHGACDGHKPPLSFP